MLLSRKIHGIPLQSEMEKKEKENEYNMAPLNHPQAAEYY